MSGLYWTYYCKRFPTSSTTSINVDNLYTVNCLYVFTNTDARKTNRGSGLECSCPDPERVRGLPRNRPRGGDLEGGGSDSRSPLCHHHHLPRLPPQILGSSRYRDRHPRAQATSAGCGLDGGNPTCDIPGPAQGLRCLGQAQVTGYPGGLWCGVQIPSPPPTLSIEDEDCGGGGRLLRCTLPQKYRGYPGQHTVAHHFQCGGRCGGLPLGIPSGGGTGGMVGRREQR